MFKKKFTVKSSSQMRQSERKLFRSLVKKLFPEATSQEMETILPRKETPYITELLLSNHQHFPTVYLLWKATGFGVGFTTNDFVISRIVNGADLMMPGVISNPALTEEFEYNTLATVNSLNNMASVAVGLTAMQSSVMRNATSGKAVIIYHYYGDKLCTLGDIAQPRMPDMGKPELSITSTLLSENGDPLAQLDVVHTLPSPCRSTEARNHKMTPLGAHVTAAIGTHISALGSFLSPRGGYVTPTDVQVAPVAGCSTSTEGVKKPTGGVKKRPADTRLVSKDPLIAPTKDPITRTNNPVTPIIGGITFTRGPIKTPKGHITPTKDHIVLPHIKPVEPHIEYEAPEGTILGPVEPCIIPGGSYAAPTEDDVVPGPSIDGIQEENETEKMDKLLIHTFYKSVKYSNTIQLPMLTSSFYKLEIMKNCPEEEVLDVKKSTYKKVSVFLREMAKEGVITLKEVKKGVETLQSIDRTHEKLKQFYVDVADRPKKLCVPMESTSRTIVESFVITPSVAGIFNAVGLHKGAALIPADIRKNVTQYVKMHNLQSTRDTKFVRVDDKNLQPLFKHEIAVTWEDLFTRVTLAMKPRISVTAGEEETVSKGKLQPITMTIQTRSGNKKVTLVDNLELYHIRISEFAKQCQHGVATSTSVTRSPGKKSDQLMIQGNQIVFVYNLLIEKYHIPQKFIKGLEFAPKKK